MLSSYKPLNPKTERSSPKFFNGGVRGKKSCLIDQQDDEEFVHTVNLTDNEQQEQEKNAEMSPNVDINANLDKLFPSHFSN